MERIVVGVDGSRYSDGVLTWSARLAERLGAELVVAHAVVSPWSEMRPQDWDELMEARRHSLAEEWTRPAIDAGARVRPVVRAGDPRSVLPEIAREEHAGLVALGRVGKAGGPGLLHVGSLVEHAVHNWPATPLAVVPGDVLDPPSRVVIGVDGSKGSSAAVAWCADVLPRLDADVVAVHVEEPLVEWTPGSSPDNWRRDVERRIAAWTEPLGEAGLEVHARAQRDFRPADALVGIAGATGADLLVTGMRGIGGFRGMRIGGVALKVLHRSSVPLVLVPEER